MSCTTKFDQSDVGNGPIHRYLCRLEGENPTRTKPPSSHQVDSTQSLQSQKVRKELLVRNVNLTRLPDYPMGISMSRDLSVLGSGEFGCLRKSHGCVGKPDQL